MNSSLGNLIQNLAQEPDLVQKRHKIIVLIKSVYEIQQKVSPSQLFEEIWGLEGLDEEQLWRVLTLVNEEILCNNSSWINESEDGEELKFEEGEDLESEEDEEGLEFEAKSWSLKMKKSWSLKMKKT